MSLDVFDEYVLICIFHYCVEDSCFSLVLTCKEFKTLIYHTPKLLHQHCKNIDQPLTLFTQNEDKHRYSYMWWLIQMNPKILQTKKCCRILDVEILKEFLNEFPCYFNLAVWSRLCSFALLYDKMNVFNFIWKKFGVQIGNSESNYVLQNIISVEKSPVLISLLSLAKHNLIKNFSKKFLSLPMTTKQKLYEESILYMYKTVDVTQIIQFDKQIREAFQSETSMKFISSDKHWSRIISLNNKDIFLYNVALIKQKSNAFISSLCYQIFEIGSDQLYFWVKKHWKKTENGWSVHKFIRIFQSNMLFDLAIHELPNMHPDLFWHYIMEYSSDSVLDLNYDKILSFAMLHPLKHHYKKVIRSIKHLQLLFQINTEISWSHVDFKNSETLLYLSKMKMNLFIDNIESFGGNILNQVLKVLRDDFNEELFSLWLTKINPQIENEIMFFLMDNMLDMVTETRFLNNARLLDSYLCKRSLSWSVITEIVISLDQFFNGFPWNLLPFFEVLKKHGHLLNIISFIEANNCFQTYHSLRLWMHINKELINN